MDVRQIYELAVDFIATLGFPIFIALWLMIRDWRIMSGILKALNDHTHAIEDNTIMLSALAAVLDPDSNTKAIFRLTKNGIEHLASRPANE